MNLQIKKALLLILCFLTSATSLVFAQTIVSGPMAGYATMIEIGIWVQLDSEAEAQVSYWIDGTENKMKSRVVQTAKDKGYTAQFKLDGLAPGFSYNYQILVNGKAASAVLKTKTQSLWQYRTDPPAFKIALGSCTYINEEQLDRPGTPYGKDYGVFDKIADMNPDMMLWLGDNIYLREADFSSWSGYLHRYSHTRSIPEMQKLLRTGHHYAIWDDHDFGPNDADGSWIHKDWALKSFDLFWMNPTVGLPDLKGSMTAFKYNDLDFFFLDNRYYREPFDQKNEAPAMLGKQQIDWLIDILKSSRAPFKMVAVGGQVLNDVAIYENYAQFKEERAYLLHRIKEEEIEGVIFLTGDRHHTELSKLTFDNGITVYDATISPLTSGAHKAEDEKNTHRVDGTYFSSQNFAIAEVSGPRKERKLNLTVYDFKGAEVWTREIAAK